MSNKILYLYFSNLFELYNETLPSSVIYFKIKIFKNVNWSKYLNIIK